MKFNSLRFKISILYTSVLGVILLAYSSILYLNLSYLLYHNLDETLENKIQEIENSITSYSEILKDKQENIAIFIKRIVNIDAFEDDELSQKPEIKKLDEIWRSKVEKLDLKDDFVTIYYPSGQIAERSDNVNESLYPLLKKLLKETFSEEAKISKLVFKDLQLRVITKQFIRRDEINYIIQIATSLKPIPLLLKSRLIFIIIVIPIVLLLTSFLGRFFVIRMFKPVTEIAQTAKAISYKDMDRRVEKKLADEEIESLVDAFNDMISRLEQSFKHIAEFSSNVAHELKTPLTVMRGESELALRKERGIEEYKGVIKINLEETKSMLKIIEDLLLLARLDYKPNAFEFEQFDLIEFFKEINKQTELLASQKDIAVDVNIPQNSININGDKFHLRRLFFNIIDNAIKYTPRKGSINITIKREKKRASVSIADTGIGISEENLPKVFDRFFCVKKNAPDTETGSGLGLSIVRSIAKMHNIDIRVNSQINKGTTVTAIFPLNSSTSSFFFLNLLLHL